MKVGDKQNEGRLMQKNHECMHMDGEMLQQYSHENHKERPKGCRNPKHRRDWIQDVLILNKDQFEDYEQ